MHRQVPLSHLGAIHNLRNFNYFAERSGDFFPVFSLRIIGIDELVKIAALGLLSFVVGMEL